MVVQGTQSNMRTKKAKATSGAAAAAARKKQKEKLDRQHEARANGTVKESSGCLAPVSVSERGDIGSAGETPRRPAESPRPAGDPELAGRPPERGHSVRLMVPQLAHIEHAEDQEELAVPATPFDKPEKRSEYQSKLLKLLVKRTDADKQAGADTELDLENFRNIYLLIFPQRSMEGDVMRWTEEAFQAIDIDGSGAITLTEIVEFLEATSRKEARRLKRPERLKQWIWQFVGNDDPQWFTEDDCLLKVLIFGWRIVSLLLAITSIVVLMIETMPKYQKADSDDTPATPATSSIEYVCVGWFTVEFIGWCLSYPYKYVRKDTGELLEPGWSDEFTPEQRLKVATRQRFTNFITDFDTWVDILSILPFYLLLIVEGMSRGAAALQTVRALRLLRLLRIMRLMRASSGQFSDVPRLGAALAQSKMSLTFLLLLIMISCTIMSTAMFYVEQDQARFDHKLQKWVRDADSDYDDRGSPTPFQSIPETMWWAIVTLTTVGYGDLFPYTVGGKVVATFTMLVGLIVVGYPITILTSTFQEMEKAREEVQTRERQCQDLYQGMKRYLDLDNEAASEEDQDNQAERSARADRNNSRVGALQDLLGASKRGSVFCHGIQNDFLRRSSVGAGVLAPGVSRRASSVPRLRVTADGTAPTELPASATLPSTRRGSMASQYVTPRPRVQDIIRDEMRGPGDPLYRDPFLHEISQRLVRASIPCAIPEAGGERKVRELRKLGFDQALAKYPRFAASLAIRGSNAAAAYRKGWEDNPDSPTGFGARMRLLLDVEDGLFDEAPYGGATDAALVRVEEVMGMLNARLQALESQYGREHPGRGTSGGNSPSGGTNSLAVDGRSAAPSPANAGAVGD